MNKVICQSIGFGRTRLIVSECKCRIHYVCMEKSIADELANLANVESLEPTNVRDKLAIGFTVPV